MNYTVRRNLILLLILNALFLACAQKRLPTARIEIRTARGESVFVDAEIADTEEERERGFMFRENIPEGTGMLFVFDRDGRLSFWMKDTPCPLSIAYIASSGRVRDIFDMTPRSLAPVNSTTSVRFALEVPQGFFERAGVQVGDVVVIDGFSRSRASGAP